LFSFQIKLNNVANLTKYLLNKLLQHIL